MFTTKNTKKFIDAWVGKFNSENKEFYFGIFAKNKKLD
jgi:hypothetical protein